MDARRKGRKANEDVEDPCAVSGLGGSDVDADLDVLAVKYLLLLVYPVAVSAATWRYADTLNTLLGKAVRCLY